MSSVKELLPENLYSQELDSNFQKWLRSIDQMLIDFSDAKK